jgi:OPA family glycerol-3-phosphate transporter-like MFS transporter
MNQTEKTEYEKKFKYWRWRVLLGFGFLYLFMYTGRMNMGIALPLLKKEFGWSSAGVGFISSMIFWTYGFSHIIWGRVSDRYGGRVLCGLGAVLSTIVNWVVSFGTTIFSIAFPWGINGIVQAMVWSPGTGMVTRWWSKKDRGTAMGLALFFAGWATVVVWILATNIAAPVWGWKGVFRFPVLLMGLMGIVSFFLVRDYPKDVGLKDYVEEDTEITEREEKEIATGIWPYINCFKNWRLDVAFLSLGLVNFTRYAFLTWIPMYYMESAKYNISKMGWVSVSLPVGMAIGPALAGWMSDKFFRSNRYQTISAYCIIAAVAAIVIGLTPPKYVTIGIVFLFLAGFFIYGAHGPTWALCQDLAGRKKAGTAAGLMDWVAYMFAAVNAVVIGSILTLTGENWTIAFVLVAVISLIAAALAWSVKR